MGPQSARTHHPPELSAAALVMAAALTVANATLAEPAFAKDWAREEEYSDGELVMISTSATSTNELAFGYRGTGHATLLIMCQPGPGSLTFGLFWGEKLADHQVDIEWSIEDGAERGPLEWQIADSNQSSGNVATLNGQDEGLVLAANVGDADRLGLRPHGEGRQQTAWFAISAGRPALSAILSACPLRAFSGR